jgi:hypothetical protein
MAFVTKTSSPQLPTTRSTYNVVSNLANPKAPGSSLTQAPDFGAALRLKPHRDPLDGAYPGVEIVAPMYMHRDGNILLFLFLYLLLTGLVGCIPSAISFNAAWFVLIVWVAALPFLIAMIDGQDRGRRLGNDIMHARWIDALTPNSDTALPRRIRQLKRINHGPVRTYLQLGFGVLFTALGITYYENRDRRPMIVLGILWILEVGFRWGLELMYNYV